MTRAARAVGLALAAAACGRGPQELRATRLLGPGDGRLRVIEGQMRRSFAIYADERRRFDVDATRGSQLRFSWARLGHWRRGQLSVVLDGRVLQRIDAGGPRGLSWSPVAIRLDGGGPKSVLELRAEGPGGGARGSDDPSAFLIGSPRVYAPRAERRRVLIWVSIDTVRADHLGAYGYARATSPALDRLARESVVFDAAVAPASWTLPALASQFTSRYPSFHGAVLEDRRLDPALPTLFDVLGAAGFTVLAVTGNPFISPDFGTASGFDALALTEGKADELKRLALAALDDWPGGDLALLVHFMDPHAPYRPPGEFRTRFDPDAASRASNQGILPGAPAGGDLQHVQALYDGELAFTDQVIGELLVELGRRRLLQDAVVVFTADHGEEFQDHGGWQHSRTLYQELVHVPLSVRAPGLAPRRVPDPVSLVDLAPTLLELLGCRSPASFQGRSLLPLLRGERGWQRAPLFSETERAPDGWHRVAVRDGASQLILAVERGREVPPRVRQEEFYDLLADPGQRRPQSDAPQAERLRREALAFLGQARRLPPPGAAAERSEDIDRQLKALGYVQ